MHNGKDLSITAETEAEVQKTLEKMPSRPILDFMVRYFVAEVNWFVSLVLGASKLNPENPVLNFPYDAGWTSFCILLGSSNSTRNGGQLTDRRLLPTLNFRSSFSGYAGMHRNSFLPHHIPLIAFGVWL